MIIISRSVKILILLIVLLLTFNKQIISHTSLYFLAKWADREIEVDEFKINYSQTSIAISGVEIKNPKGFFYDNFVEINKITIDYNLKSFFSDLIVINNLIIENPKFFLEVVEKQSSELSPLKVQNMYEDNVGAVNKIIKSKHHKLWRKKDKDTNFLILDVKMNDAKAFIKTSFASTSTKIDLSNIYFSRVGNGDDGKGYLHHKIALKSIYYNMIPQIPDLELQKFLKKIYNYKNLYMY